ncbi:acetoacetate decarboxylase [Roseococcus sp. SDR]|uniref:acetoacetate decarboxylase n=1 Tax=Roseococcus sp. SDR TaxID=2835532 RepID=UPI001BCDE29C|nr:acetoacetate decarboxylase [Roseococcus sp. SDR]MBS7791643.1 acetoacetate decarboxylase [Roseococcus sp. SDR]MBV1846957.1 acetoacetate decarboxylase [Roseococcus sp. SDR]
MEEAAIREGAFAMPRTSPSYPAGPYRFTGREYLTIEYRTEAAKLRDLVPEPLTPLGETARFQFVRIADGTGFGVYHGAAQVIPVRLPGGEAGGYVHAMYLDAHAPIAGGRELWGFPQKLARPALAVERDTLVGRLDFGPLPVAVGSMGFKHRALPGGAAAAMLAEPGVLLKIIPHVDGTPRICELVRFTLTDVTVRGAWSSPATLQFMPHALAPVAELPVLELRGATHVIADVTLALGTVLHDYLEAEDGA